MDERSDPPTVRRHREADELAGEAGQVMRAMEDFQDPAQEWRRLFSELFGTASGAQNLGPIAAIGVGTYIGLFTRVRRPDRS
jgi:hypothetical protein